MQTIIAGQDDAAQDYLADRIRDAMHAEMGGIVVTADPRLIHASVQSWKEWQRSWNRIHWIDLDYGASLGFPMNVMQTPKALLDVWASLHLPGYAEFQNAVWWYSHREETATVFDLNDYFLLRRVKECRTASLAELIIGEVLSLLAPLKMQLGQQENRLEMRRWLEEGHWVFFGVSHLEPKLQEFIAEYMAVLYENEQNDQSTFVVNGVPPSARVQRFENLVGAFSHVDDWENWVGDNRERRFTLFSTTAEEAKRLNDLGIVSVNTDTSSLKPREFIQTGQMGERRSFVSQRADPSVSAALRHQIQERDGFPRERVLSLLLEREVAR